MSQKTTKRRITLYDTTLRDGSQCEDVQFSLEDKIRIAKRLDSLGIDYIEGGWPGANPKDEMFFQAMRDVQLKNSRLVAFGSTRKAKVKAEEDTILAGLLAANTSAITIFGKSWDFHALHALRISLEENLELIYDSIRFLKQRVDELFFDAEHFFDGYTSNPLYAQQIIQVATEAGANCLVLCDTNGGTMMSQIQHVVGEVMQWTHLPVGIHCHNDSGVGVANSLLAIEAGASHVQGTINGIGERCGNADLLSILPNLMFKMNYATHITQEQMASLVAIGSFVNEMANRPSQPNQPYVGRSAFAHKGGVHVSAVLKNSAMYEHIPPAWVGNQQRVVISEQAGISNLTHHLKHYGLGKLDGFDQDKVKIILRQVKALEHKGYQFDGAEASFELLTRRIIGQLPQFFTLLDFRVIDSRHPMQDGTLWLSSDAMIKVEVGGKLEHTAAEGNGPVNALDKALRKALGPFYPQLEGMHLVDFKVRIVSTGGTEAVVRVLIESHDDEGNSWVTIGVSENIIAASYEALVDAITYKLYKDHAVVPQPL